MGQLTKDEVFALAVQRYSDTVFRAAMHNCSCTADAEDMVQDVFEKLLRYEGRFESEEHERAWFIRVTLNACRDLLRRFFRSRTVSLEKLVEQPAQIAPDHREVLEAVLALPQPYRDAVYLHYFEGMTAPQIGEALRKNVHTVYTLLTRARQRLRETLGGDAWE